MMSDENRGSLPVDYQKFKDGVYETSALSTLNIMDSLFPPPPYACHYRRGNPDLVKLTNPVYREDWEQLMSSTTGE